MQKIEISSNGVGHNSSEGDQVKPKGVDHNRVVENPLLHTPFIPASVYDSLPNLLREACSCFTEEREKDIVLLSSLTIISGCFSRVKSKYNGDWIGPNLYSFIIAPPASGKSRMKYALLLAKPIQDKMLQVRDKAERQYQTDLQSYRLAKRGSRNAEPPEKPESAVLIIPGNTSGAAMYTLLEASKGVGIICETEADSMSQAMYQEWGKFSDICRKAFHHETLSMARAKDKKYTYIDSPHLSAVLTGTPSQVTKLITSVEDGLFSRFLFYIYCREIEWNDITQDFDGIDLTAKFIELGKQIQCIYDKLNEKDYLFQVTDEQREKINQSFRSKTAFIKNLGENEFYSTVTRLGIITLRVAMVLTVLREFEKEPQSNVMICSDQDLGIALKFVDVFIEHGLIVYFMLPKKGTSGGRKKVFEFLVLLPADRKFKRVEANQIGQSLGISERTVGNYLEELVVLDKLQRPEYGCFQKV